MVDSRRNKLVLNTLSSVSLQITTIVCAFILPRLILATFGSNVNGLVNSVAHFLGVISLLEFGVGSVVRSAFFRPLANKDIIKISKIYDSSNRFFRKLGSFFLLYTIVLMIVYPMINNSQFDCIYIDCLIGVMSISAFFQYYFGITNALLLDAHQKAYVINIIQTILITFNTAICTLVMFVGGSIQLVKLISSIIFIIRPLFLYYYVRTKYNIVKNIKYNVEPIKQKWNGMAQHFAAFVLEGTDSIVLTIWSSLAAVSIYSVYYMVIVGLKGVLSATTNGMSPLIGDMLAKDEKEKLENFFSLVEWSIHTETVLVFGCAGILIVPFVSIYTAGINDANYIQPLFAVLIVLAHAGHMLRLPYNMVILAAGHYRQTQKCYIVSMMLNIIISILFVSWFGLVGVAVGTLIAMTYQTIWMANYISKYIINWPVKKFYKQLIVDVVCVVIASFLTYRINLLSLDYFSWVMMAIEVFVIWFLVVLIVNLMLYKNNLKKIGSELYRKHIW